MENQKPGQKCSGFWFLMVNKQFILDYIHSYEVNKRTYRMSSVVR
jgi:hypothetical protein